MRIIISYHTFRYFRSSLYLLSPRFIFSRFTGVLLLLFILSSFISCNKSEETILPARVGVIENQFDNIQNVLKRYHIDYKMIKYRDIESKSIYTSFDALFFPCGAEPPLTSSMNILSRGTHIEGVSLKDDYYKVDTIKSGVFLKDYFKRGGAAYFSDFSFKYLQDSTKVFNFYKDFPYIGRAGQLKAEVSGEFRSYTTAKSVFVNIGHEGWVIPDHIRNGETLLSARAETPLGVKTAPISSLIRKGAGQMVFTSYHNENDNTGIIRYLIMRTIYKREIESLSELAVKWEQTVQSRIADKSLSGETARSYSMKVLKGRNDLYFRNDGGQWQIDIFDGDGTFLYSYNMIGKDFRYEFDSSDDKIITVKIIPLSPTKFNSYTAITASGIRIMPYYLHIIVIFIGLVLIVIYIRYLRIERFRGKVHSSGPI